MPWSAPENASDSDESAVTADDASGYSGKIMLPPTLLVMDDEPAIASLIRRAAESCGYEALAATDFSAFKRAYNAARPDLICLDLTMPDADGIEVLRFLADIGCQSGILIISGFNPQMVQSAMRLGEALGLRMTGTIAKPIRLATLRSLLVQLGHGQSDPAAP